MVKFVWLDVAGGQVPVNPDQVAYIKRSGASTSLVFGAVAGGLHELVVLGDGEEVAWQLEGQASPTGARTGLETAQTPPGAPPGPRGRRKRRDSRGPHSQQP